MSGRADLIRVFLATGALAAIAGGFVYLPIANADTDSNAAVQVLRELSELHVQQFQVFCIPHSDFQQFEPSPSGDVTVGAARIHGKTLYLDRQLICGPLKAYYLEPQGTTPTMSRPLLLALNAVAATYGFTIGLGRYYVAECYAARVVWKWVLRSEPGYKLASRARRILLDNSYRPNGYKLRPNCTLSNVPS